MNNVVKSGIEGRRSAITNTFNLDDNMNSVVSELFDRIYAFGEKYDDYESFEKDFAGSDLNKEYLDLFTTISTSYSVAGEDNTDDELDEIVDDISSPLKMQARDQIGRKVRTLPVIGDVLEVKQHYDLLSRFKKKKDD